MTAVSNAVPLPDAETTISPEHLSITTRWPSGGAHNIHLMTDSDLSMRVHSDGKRPDGVPMHYDHEAGHVLVLLGIDDDHDEVHVQPPRYGDVDMIEALQQTVEVCQRSLDALRKIKACRI